MIDAKPICCIFTACYATKRCTPLPEIEVPVYDLIFPKLKNVLYPGRFNGIYQVLLIHDSSYV
jgi:hypothetical protein